MGSGTITEFPNEICGGAAVATEPFTNNIGRDINFSGCNDAGGNLQFQEVDGGLDASASTGVVGDLSIFYYSISTDLDFCSGDSALLRYQISDNTPCSVSLITDDDNGVCRTSFVLYPNAIAAGVF